MDLNEKFVWFVVVVGILTFAVFVAVKIGEVVVRRRTATLIAAHEDDGDDPPPGERGRTNKPG